MRQKIDFEPGKKYPGIPHHRRVDPHAAERYIKNTARLKL